MRAGALRDHGVDAQRHGLDVDASVPGARGHAWRARALRLACEGDVDRGAAGTNEMMCTYMDAE